MMNDMIIRKDFGNVRIVWDGDPMQTQYDIRVEWKVNGEWELYRGFNSFTNDYAHSSANEAAGEAIAKLAKAAVV